MTSDPFEAFKASQREVWKSFAPLAQSTTPSAARLVRFAGVRPGQAVLDVGGGTGVVAITARRVGAVVTGGDLTPELLAVAHGNAAIARATQSVGRPDDRLAASRERGPRRDVRSGSPSHGRAEPAALPSHARTEWWTDRPPAANAEGRSRAFGPVPTRIRRNRLAVLRRQHRAPEFPRDSGD